MDPPPELNWIARLQFRAVRSLWKRIERSPEFRGSQRQGRLAEPVLVTGKVFAGGSDEDEAVAARLRAHVKNPEAANCALGELECQRERAGRTAYGPRAGDDARQLSWGFEEDRLYRLLYAVVHDCEVPEVDPVWREEYDEQRRLSRLPVGEAFDRLARRAPKLNELERDVIDGRVRKEADACEIPYSGLIDERLEKILTSADDPVLHSPIAAHAASLYLLMRAGEIPEHLDTPATPTA